MIPALWIKIIAGGSVVALLGGGLWFMQHRAYKNGVKETVSEFIEADKEEANEIRKTAQEILRDIGGIDDPDELLRRTGGLRD